MCPKNATRWSTICGETTVQLFKLNAQPDFHNDINIIIYMATDM